VHCTNFNIRFYPMVQEARVRASDLGEIWNVHGGYLQDWLLHPTDWNWRLQPERGGALRAVGDIGSHWLDLVQFATGLEVEGVFADLATAIPVRQRPTGDVETFAAADDIERVDEPMATEDLAHILVRFGGGARGSCVVSQVSAGRKNAIRFEVDGSRGSLAWDGEAHEQLWLGRRDAPNELLLRNPTLMGASAQATTHLPAGHAEGFADTFRELYRAVYRAVAAGEPGSEYPTFRAGHVENVLGEAIAESSRDGRWVEVSL
jgi:predicted dehydrogenase